MKINSELAAGLSSTRRRLLLWGPFVLGTVAVAAVLIAIVMLYHITYEWQERYLKEMVQNRASLLEAIGEENGWNEKETLELFTKARAQCHGLGETGEFVIARPQGDKMHFLMCHRGGKFHQPAPIPLKGDLAEPMRRSLRGERGTTVGLDYKGRTVLATYRDIPRLGWGVVAKIDLSEIRSPFIHAGIIVIGVAFVLVGLGSYVLVRLAMPVIEELANNNRRLEHERNRAREYFEIAGTILIVLDPQGNIVLLNRKGRNILEYKEEEIIGRNWFETCLPEPIRQSTLAVFRKLVAGNLSPKDFFENGVVTKSGQTRTIAWSNAPLRDENGKIIGTLSSGEDITDRNLAAKEREMLIANLEAQNAELERFTYVVSHDLKSPLITIKGYAGMLEEDLHRENLERAEKDINRIANAADHMSELLDELLELSRIGRLVNPPENISLNDLVLEAIAAMEIPLAKKNIEVVVEPDMPQVNGDHNRLCEVIQNLIENAAKYMGDQSTPRIEISAQCEGDDITCRVRDNGMGIDPRFHEKIFGLFERLDQQTEGTGIGLALAKRIIEIHNGRIWVESEGDGRGSCFCFTLPKEAGIGLVFSGEHA